MPGLVKGEKTSRKRKWIDANTPELAASMSSSHDEILQLENNILESRRNFNSIATLLGYIGKPGVQDEQKSMFAVVVLCRVFCRLMASGKMSKSRDNSTNESLIILWLTERLQEYRKALLSMLASPGSDESLTALDLLMRLIKEEAMHLKADGEDIWGDGAFSKILKLIIDPRSIDDLRQVFIDKYLQKYDDIRYCTFGLLKEFISDNVSPISIEIVISILAAPERVPKVREDINDFFAKPPIKIKHKLYSAVAHKRLAQESWMAVLGRDMNLPQRKTALELMSRRIAPWFLNVELLLDFLTDSFNFGGSTSLLALSGLFYLMQEKNLDYPQFYQKLYSLLDPDILHSKHRSRFFRLLDTFLSSTHLPAALVASFIKRLSRLLLHAPPSGIIVAMPWIYNLLKNHPTCTFMIHRKLQSEEAIPSSKNGNWGDPFLMEESDPMETHALESSLWEVQMLNSHYHPNVATIAKIISEQFTKQAYNLEDFLDHSYGSMLAAELARDIKKGPEIEFEIPKRIFYEHEAESGKQDSLLVQLWDFS